MTAEIARPPRVVFDFLETPENAPRWIDGVVACTVVEGRRRSVGARILRTTVVGGRTLDVLEAVTAYDDGVRSRRLGRAGSVRYEAMLAVEDAGDGRTRVTLDCEATPAGLLGWLRWPRFAAGMRRRFDAMLATAKRVLEEEADRAYRSPG